MTFPESHSSMKMTSYWSQDMVIKRKKNKPNVFYLMGTEVY